MDFDIVVEIGTSEEQESIKSEISLILDWLGDDYLSLLNIKQIIVPQDFDSTVNNIQGTTSYTSNRIQMCVGKILESTQGNYIVISAISYYGPIDFCKRCQFIIHETYHLYNRTYFEFPEPENTAEYRYKYTAAIMYDEYSANMFSFKIMAVLSKQGVFPNLDESVFEDYNGHLSSILSPGDYYEPLKKVYDEWRLSKDTIEMLNGASTVIDAAIKDLTYCHSYADSFEFIFEDFSKQKLIFQSDSTQKLFDLFREWRESRDTQFADCIELTRDVMAGLGIVFSDAPNGERFDLVDF